MSVNLEQLLNPTIGYFQLGMLEEAVEEIEALPVSFKVLPQVVRLRAEIYTLAESWERLREMALVLVELRPDDSQNWIWLGYATRRCRSIEEAEQALIEALELHETEPMIHFNLACYAAQTGHLKTARLRLARAISLDPMIKTQALPDEDLQPLWAELQP